MPSRADWASFAEGVKKDVIILLAALSSAVAADYPDQRINRVDSVHFGQPQPEVERILERKALPGEPPISRAGKDYVLEAAGTKLDLLSGRKLGQSKA